jgi:HSP20 family protein
MPNNLSLKKNDSPTAAVQREATRTVVFTPRCDILETDEELLLLTDMPGVTVDDIDVCFENGELTIHARCQPRHADVEYVRAEYQLGDFHRVFSVNEDIDADKIAAQLGHGVLTVHLPKSEKVKPKKVTVKSE